MLLFLNLQYSSYKILHLPILLSILLTSYLVFLPYLAIAIYTYRLCLNLHVDNQENMQKTLKHPTELHKPTIFILLMSSD